MLYIETILQSADNSSVNKVKCIKILGGSFKKSAKIGDSLVVSKKTNKKTKIISQEKIFKGLLITSKQNFLRIDGSAIRFNKNFVVLISKQQTKLIGSRLLKPTIKELRNKKYSKILFLKKKVY